MGDKGVTPDDGHLLAAGVRFKKEGTEVGRAPKAGLDRRTVPLGKRKYEPKCTSLRTGTGGTGFVAICRTRNKQVKKVPERNWGATKPAMHEKKKGCYNGRNLLNSWRTRATATERGTRVSRKDSIREATSRKASHRLGKQLPRKAERGQGKMVRTVWRSDRLD